MFRIGIVIHGPEVIDSGKAQTALESLSELGCIRAVLGGTMGRAAVIDAALEDLIDISSSSRPSESIIRLGPESDFILLLNEGKSRDSGLAFGRMVFNKVKHEIPALFQLEFGDGCILIPWTGTHHPAFNTLLDILGARVCRVPDEVVNISKNGDKVTRRICGIRPGEYITVNGIVIGRALSDYVLIEARSGKITGLIGGRLKLHGVEKLKSVDLTSAIIRSGPLRTARITPRVIRNKSYGYAVLIDHSAEDTFEIAKDAELAVVVGDDTTTIAGDLLTRLDIPMIGITDGDRDGLTHYTHLPPGSAIIKLTAGYDDILGQQVQQEIFRGKERIRITEKGFDSILSEILDMAKGKVEDMTRY